MHTRPPAAATYYEKRDFLLRNCYASAATAVFTCSCSAVEIKKAWKQDHVKTLHDPLTGFEQPLALAWTTGGVLATMTKYVTISGALVSSNLKRILSVCQRLINLPHYKLTIEIQFKLPFVVISFEAAFWPIAAFLEH